MATKRPDGRYVVMVRTAPGPKGRRPIYGATDEAAERAAAKFREALKPTSPLQSYSKGSFAEFVYTIYLRRVYPDLRETSKRKYDGLLTHHLLPALGRCQLNKIGFDEFQQMKEGLRRVDKRPGTLSPAQKREILLRGREIMQLALDMRRTTLSDWRLVTLPKKPSKKKRHEPESDFTVRILRAAEGTYMQGPLFAAMFLGLRRGETCGLMWSAIDESALTITVSEQLQPKDGQVPTKGEPRIIPITADLLKGLKRYADPSSPYLFTDNGKPLKPNEVSKWPPRLCAKAGLKKTTYHDLRAYAASNLLRAGVDIVSILEILGHQKMDTTMLYLYGREEAKRTGLDKLLEMVDGPKPDNRKKA